MGHEGGRRLLLEIHQNLPGTDYPDPKILDGFVSTLRHKNLLEKSDRSQGDKPLTWIGSFVIDLTTVNQRSKEILSQFSQQDGELVAVAEELSNRSQQLLFWFQTVDSFPDHGVSFYKDGTNAQMADFIRYYCLTLMKAHGVIQKFGIRD